VRTASSRSSDSGTAPGSMYHRRAAVLLQGMTPHPLATFGQISVSPQWRERRRRRLRRAAALHARRHALPRTEP
jgi:hypothetical protein